MGTKKSCLKKEIIMPKDPFTATLTIPQQKELIRLMELEAKMDARKSYLQYVRYTNPGYKLMHYNRLIIKVIQEAIDLQDKMKSGEIPAKNQYMMFSLPPRHGKSMAITETLPSFMMGREKRYKVILTAYSATLADDFARANSQKVIDHNVFDIFVKQDNQDRTAYSNLSVCVKAGIMGGVTGKGCHLLIIDDPIKLLEEASSESHKNKMWGEWTASLSTRLEPPAIVILIMTRWAMDDLAGRLLNPEYGRPLPWQVINLPLEAEENDILGRAVGEPLWADRYGLDFIEERKQYLQIFNALYQGRPSDKEGNLFKRHYWQFYEPRPEFIARIPMLILSVDAAFKNTSDPVGIHVWGKHMTNYYLVDRINKRLTFTETLAAIRLMVNKYPTMHLKLIEDKANGSAIIDVLNKEIGGFVPVQPYGSKKSRAEAVIPYIESGNVFLPSGVSWVNEYIEQCAVFPSNKDHDEDPDCTSQALSRLINMGTIGNVKGTRPTDPYGLYEPPDDGSASDSYINMTVH